MTLTKWIIPHLETRTDGIESRKRHFRSGHGYNYKTRPSCSSSIDRKRTNVIDKRKRYIIISLHPPLHNTTHIKIFSDKLLLFTVFAYLRLTLSIIISFIMVTQCSSTCVTSRDHFKLWKWFTRAGLYKRRREIAISCILLCICPRCVSVSFVYCRDGMYDLEIPND